MNIRMLPLRNLLGRPFRTLALLLIAAVMSASVFGGMAASASLQNGLSSLESRLGADIIVLPDDAKAAVDLKNILLQGTPGYFYMERSVQEGIAAVEGVAQTSSQYYLVSANAECCTVQVQIIGFDEETDFSVKPWLKQAYSGQLGENEIIVGAALSTQTGHSLKLYGVECKAVGKLEATGTGLDTAIYTTDNTVRTMIRAAEEKGIHVLSRQSPDDMLSSVYVKVQDGYDIGEVEAKINLTLDGVQAVRTRSVLTGTADKLAVISGSIRLLIVVVWVLAVVILTASFSVMASVRRREFAVLRTLGFSRRQLVRIVMTESSAICFAGAAAGLLIAWIAVYAFGRQLEIRAGLPYLLPDVLHTVVYALTAAAAVWAASMLASAYSAYGLSHTDAGNILREGD